jgi:hypothetical protein
VSTARTLLPVALVAVSLLTACGGTGVLGQAASVPGTDEVIGVGDDPRVLVHDFTWALEAQIIGELEYLPESGCLVINFRDADTGLPNGVFMGMRAPALVTGAIPEK